jgi:hypothetical protein
MIEKLEAALARLSGQWIAAGLLDSTDRPGDGAAEV